MPPRLRNATLSPEYRRHLREAGAWIIGVVASLGGKITAKSNSRDIDRWLERAVDWGHKNDEKLYWVRLGVLGVQRALKLSGPLLRGTWAALRAWRQLQPVRSRIPMSHFVLECLLVTCLGRGNSCSGAARFEWWSVMLAIWLSFEALLRPGETEALMIGDLCFPENSELAEGVSLVVGIKRPKTRRVWVQQFALVQSASLVAWLRWWVVGAPRSRKLFPIPRRRWALRMRDALEMLELQGCHYTLGSLRGGGATHHFRVHRNLGQLQYAGRWKRLETLQHYLHEALSVQVVAQAPESALQRLHTVHQRASFLLQPPPRALSQLV